MGQARGDGRYLMVEAVPLLGLSLALLIDLCELMFILALLFVWRQTFGALFKLAADALTFTINTHLGYSHTFHLGRPFAQADYAITTWLNAEKVGLDIEIGATWHALQAAWTATAESLDWLARETADTLDWFSEVKLPKWAKYILTAGIPSALISKLIASAIHHLHPIISRVVKVIYRDIPHAAERVAHKTIAATIPGAHAIPRIEREIVGLTKRNLRISKRLHRVEGLFGVAVMAAAMANVLGLPNWRCLTRGNVGRLARHVCGLDRWLLDFLLLGAVEAFVAADLCGFSDLLIKQAETLRPALMDLVDVEDALIGCHGTSKPMLFNLPAASLPPLQGISPLAA